MKYTLNKAQRQFIKECISVDCIRTDTGTYSMMMESILKNGYYDHVDKRIMNDIRKTYIKKYKT